VAESGDFGVTYGVAQQVDNIFTFMSLPDDGVDPEISAAVEEENVLICCTLFKGSYLVSECIYYAWQKGGGTPWSTLHRVDGEAAYRDDFGVALCADRAGHYFHLAYTSEEGMVYYNRLDQSLNYAWTYDPPFTVNDLTGTASTLHHRKAIVDMGDSFDCGILWTDCRDSIIDMDTYFDFTDNSCTYYVPKEYSTLQGAIDACSDLRSFNRVEVSPGTYQENVDFKGKEGYFVGIGGAMRTVLDGGQYGPVVTFQTDEDGDTILAGFTITNGYSIAGGGIRCEGTHYPHINNCIIAGNGALKGGGVYCGDNSNPVIWHTTIMNNYSPAAGGGHYSEKDGNGTYQNCIFWGNTAPVDPQIHWDPLCNPSLHDCCVEGGWTLGTGNIDDDPLFANEAKGDYHLTFNSPCRDTGGWIMQVQTDFEGDPREYPTPDMGADEFHLHLYCTGKLAPGGKITLHFVGEPGKAVNGLIVGVNLLPEPLWCDYGKWYLADPILVLTGLGKIPSDGIQTLTGVIGASPPGPYTLYLQAAVDFELSNLLELQVH
jgi:hypothetical protein